jgi:plastocyanin
MRKPVRASLSILTGLAISTAGCGSGSESTSHAPTRTIAATRVVRGEVHIVMRALWFYPVAVDASVGQRVMWTNDDSSPHNVTYVSGPEFRSSRRMMKPGAKFSIRLTKPGTIHYFCSLHPWMKATIVVSR